METKVKPCFNGPQIYTKKLWCDKPIKHSKCPQTKRQIVISKVHEFNRKKLPPPPCASISVIRKNNVSTLHIKNNLLITNNLKNDCNTTNPKKILLTSENWSASSHTPALENYDKKMFKQNLGVLMKSFKYICGQIKIFTTKVTNHSSHQHSLRRSKTSRVKCKLLPRLGATSFFTLLTLICLETILLSTVSNCAKTFYMHWNTSNSIFRIDNTDHIIDVNKGNLAFEFDQVHIICPVYEPGTYENETEKYIIYNVSKVEYETCRITNADPRVIAICDKPQKLMFFTITFRPFTPQPGGLEFLPGNDYYFISTSSKDDLYRRIGGRCSTNNMKVVFKVCCATEEVTKNASTNANTNSFSNNGLINGKNNSDNEYTNTDILATSNNNHNHMNSINTIGMGVITSGQIPNGGIHINNGNINGIHLKPINNPTTSSINTNLDQFNRIPIQPNGINVVGNNYAGISHGANGILLTPSRNGVNLIPTVNGGGILQFPSHIPGQTGIRINNVPSSHYPTHKNNNNDDHHFDKHPNEVVKNEELTYNSAASKLNHFFIWNLLHKNIITTKIRSAISATHTKLRKHMQSTLHFIKNELCKQQQQQQQQNFDFKGFIQMKNIINLNVKSIVMIQIFCMLTVTFWFSKMNMLFLKRYILNLKLTNALHFFTFKNAFIQKVNCKNEKTTNNNNKR